MSKKPANLFFSGNNADRKRYGNQNYDGKMISNKVMVVMENIPASNHFKADAIIAGSSDTTKLNWKFYSSVPLQTKLIPDL